MPTEDAQALSMTVKLVLQPGYACASDLWTGQLCVRCGISDHQSFLTSSDAASKKIWKVCSLSPTNDSRCGVSRKDAVIADCLLAIGQPGTFRVMLPKQWRCLPGNGELCGR